MVRGTDGLALDPLVLGLVVGTVFAWLATYLVHSLLLLGVAAALAHRVVRSPAGREVLWRAALVGGLLSATGQTVLAHTSVALEPVMGMWPLEAGPGASDLGPVGAAPAIPLLQAGVLLTWGLIAAGLLGRVALHHFRLVRRLGTRRPVPDPRLVALLDRVRCRVGVRRPLLLTVSTACTSPLVLSRGEICVPHRFLTEPDEEEQRAALAHEVAHIARGDPLWRLVTATISSVFFLQPLNRKAARALAETAEELCDEEVAREMGDGLPLARCLARVAEWIEAEREIQGAQWGLAMARSGGFLSERIRRLVETRVVTPRPRRGLQTAAAVGLVLAVGAAGPAFHGGAEAASSEEPVVAVPTVELPASRPTYEPESRSGRPRLDLPAEPAVEVRSERRIRPPVVSPRREGPGVDPITHRPELDPNAFHE